MACFFHLHHHSLQVMPGAFIPFFGVIKIENFYVKLKNLLTQRLQIKKKEEGTTNMEKNEEHMWQLHQNLILFHWYHPTLHQTPTFHCFPSRFSTCLSPLFFTFPKMSYPFHLFQIYVYHF